MPAATDNLSMALSWMYFTATRHSLRYQERESRSCCVDVVIGDQLELFA